MRFSKCDSEIPFSENPFLKNSFSKNTWVEAGLFIFGPCFPAARSDGALRARAVKVAFELPRPSVTAFRV
jgi:hypothetical protein